MTLTFTPHQKLSLRRHPTLNEVWLHERISENTGLLDLGDVRVLARERRLVGGGRLDLLLQDEENDRRYEVEIQLGATDPSHIIRTIEHWDLERRRYPGYEHTAVLIAEDVTARFLNVLSLMSGTIPIIALQLDALQIDDRVLLNFTRVLDQTELRVDDTEEDSGGGQVDRAYWENRVGADLMRLCEEVFAIIDEAAPGTVQPNYLKQYIGMRVNGVSDNVVGLAPKSSSRLVHIRLRNPNAERWKERFEEAGVPAKSRRQGRVQASVTPDEFAEQKELIRAAVVDSMNEAGL